MRSILKLNTRDFKEDIIEFKYLINPITKNLFQSADFVVVTKYCTEGVILKDRYAKYKIGQVVDLEEICEYIRTEYIIPEEV